MHEKTHQKTIKELRGGADEEIHMDDDLNEELVEEHCWWLARTPS